MNVRHAFEITTPNTDLRMTFPGDFENISLATIAIETVYVYISKLHDVL